VGRCFAADTEAGDQPGRRGAPAMSEALFLCRDQNGLDHACGRALAKALMLDTKTGARTPISNRRCQADQQVLADLDRRD
jgi:hypothetical protein